MSAPIPAMRDPPEKPDRAGRGFARRWARGDIERAVQPGEPQIKDADGGIGDPYRVVDTLKKMFRAGTISDEMLRAGQQFRDDFTVAHFEAIHAPDLARVPGQHHLSEMSNRRIDAGNAVWDALSALGGASSPGGTCVWHVVGRETSLKEWAQREGWCGRPLDVTAARGILVGSLGVLAAGWLTRRLRDRSETS